MSGCEVAGTSPQGGERASIVENIHIKAVIKIVVPHEAEDIVVDIAEIVDLTISQLVLGIGDGVLTSGSTLQ